jgi:hypothetical protein
MNINEIREICFRYASENRGLPSAKTAGSSSEDSPEKDSVKSKKKKSPHRQQTTKDFLDLSAMGHSPLTGWNNPLVTGGAGAGLGAGIGMAASGVKDYYPGKERPYAAAGAGIGGIAGLIYGFIQRQRRKALLKARDALESQGVQLHNYGHGE